MPLNVERRNRNEALTSERGETCQKSMAKLATVINLPIIPNKTCWRLRMHSSFIFLSTTSDELISYAADSFFKLTDSSLRETTHLLNEIC